MGNLKHHISAEFSSNQYLINNRCITFILLQYQQHNIQERTNLVHFEMATNKDHSMSEVHDRLASAQQNTPPKLKILS